MSVLHPISKGYIKRTIPSLTIRKLVLSVSWYTGRSRVKKMTETAGISNCLTTQGESSEGDHPSAICVGEASLSGDFGFQNNHRQEWVFFILITVPSLRRRKTGQRTGFRSEHSQCIGKSPLYRLFFSREHALGWDGQHQRNDISGYSFACCLNTTVPPPDCFGLRLISLIMFSLSVEECDMTWIVNISSHEDAYLADYLRKQGYDT